MSECTLATDRATEDEGNESSVPVSYVHRESLASFAPLAPLVDEDFFAAFSSAIVQQLEPFASAKVNNSKYVPCANDMTRTRAREIMIYSVITIDRTVHLFKSEAIAADVQATIFTRHLASPVLFHK